MKIMKRFLRDWIIQTRLPWNLKNKLFVCLTYSDFVERILHTTRIPHTYDARDHFWGNIVERIGSDTPILFLEFGVCRGESIIWFSKRFCNQRSLFFGFDTFTGLPQDWDVADLPSGTFSCQGQVPLVEDSRVTFVKGLFSDTLPKTIDRIKKESQGRILLVHLDADLFSSTLFVLTFLWQWVDHYYVLFDEFFGEESWALSTFSKTFPCQLEFVVSDASNGKMVPTPCRVFGSIRNTGERVGASCGSNILQMST